VIDDETLSAIGVEIEDLVKEVDEK
jgi:hypothetical protein